MNALSCGTCFSSVFHSQSDKKEILLRKNDSKCNLKLPKNHSFTGRVSCKLSGSGIEESPKNQDQKASGSSKKRMEEYNIAMKRMMRNPYEYHHDLGLCSLDPFPYFNRIYICGLSCSFLYSLSFVCLFFNGPLSDSFVIHVNWVHFSWILLGNCSLCVAADSDL